MQGGPKQSDITRMNPKAVASDLKDEFIRLHQEINAFDDNLYLAKGKFGAKLPDDATQKERETFELNQRQLTRITAMPSLFNNISSKVIDDLLEAPSQAQQQEIFDFYCLVMAESMQNGDYQTVQALLSALDSREIRRLPLKANSKYSDVIDRADVVFDVRGNFRNLRADIKERVAAGKEVVYPFNILTKDINASRELENRDARESTIRKVLSDMRAIPMPNRKGKVVTNIVAHVNSATSEASSESQYNKSLEIKPAGGTPDAYFRQKFEQLVEKKLVEITAAKMEKEIDKRKKADPALDSGKLRETLSKFNVDPKDIKAAIDAVSKEVRADKDVKEECLRTFTGKSHEELKQAVSQRELASAPLAITLAAPAPLSVESDLMAALAAPPNAAAAPNVAPAPNAAPAPVLLEPMSEAEHASQYAKEAKQALESLTERERAPVPSEPSAATVPSTSATNPSASAPAKVERKAPVGPSPGVAAAPVSVPGKLEPKAPVGPSPRVAATAPVSAPTQLDSLSSSSSASAVEAYARKVKREEAFSLLSSSSTEDPYHKMVKEAATAAVKEAGLGEEHIAPITQEVFTNPNVAFASPSAAYTKGPRTEQSRDKKADLSVFDSALPSPSPVVSSGSSPVSSARSSSDGINKFAAKLEIQKREKRYNPEGPQAEKTKITQPETKITQSDFAQRRKQEGSVPQSRENSKVSHVLDAAAPSPLLLSGRGAQKSPQSGPADAPRVSAPNPAAAPAPDLKQKKRERP